MYSATFLATIEKPVRDHLWKKKKNHANKSEGGVMVCSFF